MKNFRDEVAQTLEDETDSIEEQQRRKEQARREKKERDRLKKKNKLIERLIAPGLFVLTLLVSAVVMLLFR